MPPGLIRNASLADKMPKSQPPQETTDSVQINEVRKDSRKSERRRERSTSRDRQRNRRERSRSREKGERREKKERRDKMDKAHKDSGSSRSGDATRAEEETSRGPADFSDQIGSSGFMQFPGQYGGAVPGPGPVPSEHPESISPYLQDQFPGQLTTGSSAPYRPPLASSDGGPGLAAEYYGDAGESVAHQPGYRKHSPSLIIEPQSHLRPASSIADPPPEPSASGQVGAAASFFNGEFDDAASSTAPPISSTYISASSKPDNNHHSSSAPVVPTLGSAALGAGVGYIMSGGVNGSSASHESRPDYVQSLGGAPIGHSTSTTQGPISFTQESFQSTSSLPIKPGKISQSSNIPLYAAGTAGAAALAGAAYSHNNHSSAQHPSAAQQYPATPMKHRHRRHGPLGAVVEFFRDPDGVAQYEEYSEIIGVCRGCFEQGSSPRDAPRKHRFYKRRSVERLGSSTRIEKQHRYSSSEDESRRKNNSSWLGSGLGAGVAGYGLGKIGETLFNQRNDFGNGHDAKSGRFSPNGRSQVSRRATGKSGRKSRSSERVEPGLTSDGNVYKKGSQGGGLSGSSTTTYATRPPRSRSRDRKGGPVGAALGATAVSSITKSSNHRRSRSPNKRLVKEKYSSPERHRKHKKKKKKEKGFLSFLSPNSSTSTLELNSRSDKEKGRKGRGSTDRIQNDREAEAALLGLGAATAALALKDGRSSNKARKDLMVVKDMRHKPRRSSSKSKHSSAASEEFWESVSEGEFSNVDSDLAFGSPSRRGSRESLASQNSGTDKWDWRWGSTKKKRDPPKRIISADGVLPLAAGSVVAAFPGGTIMPPDQYHEPPKISGTSGLPLQRVYPVPTSDPDRFDVRREGSIASSGQPVMVSRPEVVPLQQPQPIAPVSSSFYASQGPDARSYGAPTGVPVFSQPPFTKDAPESRAHGAVSHVDEGTSQLVKDFKLQRRGTSPARFGEDSISSSMAPQRRPSSKDDSSAVRFAISEKQEEKDRKDRRQKRKAEKEQGEQRDFERKAFEEKSSKRPEAADIPFDVSHQKSDTSWVAPVAGIAGVAIGAAAIVEKSKKDETREERRERRRREREQEDDEDASRRAERRRRKEREREQERETDRQRENPEEIHVSPDGALPSSSVPLQEEAGAKTFTYEDYQSFFTPIEVLNKSGGGVNPSNVNRDTDPGLDGSAAIVEIAPKTIKRQPDEPEWSVADTNDKIDLSQLSLPWEVPHLKLVQPTPPASRAPTPLVPTEPTQRDVEDITKPRSPAKVTWGDDQTHEYTENAPIEHPDELIKPSSNESVKGRRTREYSDSESDDGKKAQKVNEQMTAAGIPSPNASSPNGDDYEFAATLAASAQDAGFDPSIVIDDPTYRRRDSPPGSSNRSMPGGFNEDDGSKSSKKDKKKRDKARNSRDHTDVLGERDDLIVEKVVRQREMTEPEIGEDDPPENFDDIQRTKKSKNSKKKGRKDSEDIKVKDDGPDITLGRRVLYDSPPEDASSNVHSQHANDQGLDKTTRKNSKRQSSGFDDAASTVSSTASVESPKDTKSKAKKASLWDRVLGKSTDSLPQANDSADAAKDVNLDESEEPKKRSKKSKERRPSDDLEDDSMSVTRKTSKSTSKKKGRQSGRDVDVEDSGRITQDLQAKVYPSSVPGLSFLDLGASS